MGLKEQIEQKIRTSFNVRHIEVINESHLHHGHSGDDGSGESHFRLVLSSPDFNGLSRVDAQRSVFNALADEMKVIHALSVKIFTA